MSSGVSEAVWSEQSVAWQPPESGNSRREAKIGLQNPKRPLLAPGNGVAAMPGCLESGRGPPRGEAGEET